MPLGRSDTLTFGILGTNFWSSLFTTKEIIAVLLHEIGHALTISRVSTFTYLLYSTIVSLFQATISESQTKLRFLHTMLIDFAYGLLIAFRNMRNEIYADSFAVSCGYGEYLKKALIRLTNIYSEQSTLRDEQSRNTIVKRFVPHLEDVKDRLEQIDNEIKAHLEVQAERAKLKEKLQQSLLLQQKQK
jgi:Zn-dependent protease with chaperone function